MSSVELRKAVDITAHADLRRAVLSAAGMGVDARVERVVVTSTDVRIYVNERYSLGLSWAHLAAALADDIVLLGNVPSAQSAVRQLVDAFEFLRACVDLLDLRRPSSRPRRPSTALA